MMRYSWVWPTIIICSTIAVGFVNFTGVGIGLRPIITMWFLFVCPGMALIRFLRLNGLAVELTLAVAVSFSLDAIIAGIQMYAGLWSPTGTLDILICLCMSGAVVQLALPRSVSKVGRPTAA